MTIDDIKNWLEEAISLLETNSRDTVPDRIRENRRRWGAPYRKREEIKSWVQTNKPTALPYLTELNMWIKDYYLYFTPAYKPVSGETIDTLPGLILGRLEFIRTKIESL